MRRGVATFLAVCMILQTPVGMLPVHAAQFGGMRLPLLDRSYGLERIASGSDLPEIASDSTAQTAVSRTETKASEEEPEQESGTLKLELHNLLGAADCSFHVRLVPSESTARKREIPGDWAEDFSTDWEESGKYVWELGDVPDGAYSLYLEPEGGEPGAYLPYEHKRLRIKKGTVTTLHLANDYPEYHGYESEGDAKTRMGVLMAGNFSTGGDKEVIDEEDLDLMLDAIYSESDDPQFDLNGDQSVDLIDLEYFAKFYNKKDIRKASAAESPLVTDDMIFVATDSDATPVDEDELKQLFSGAAESGREDEAVLTAEPVGDGAITATNPVVVGAEFSQAVSVRGFAIVPPVGSGSAMEDGVVTFIAENGDKYEAIIENGEQVGEVIKTRAKARAKASASNAQKAVRATDSDAGILAVDLVRAAAEVVDEDQPIQGRSVVIDLGGQIPVKKVTIRITRTVAGTNLAEISKVEFLNNMEDHIPEPELSVPDLLKGEPGDAQFAVSWRRQNNVTGYDVWVGGETVSGYKEQVFQGIEEHRLEVTAIGGAEVDNNQEYMVKVRSVNGDWRSPYSESVTVIPEAVRAPEPPEQIRVTGGYQKLTISWKKMKSTDSYTLYYRETGTEEDAEFIAVEGIRDTQTELKNLKDGVTYELYMTGTNQVGTSVPSERYTGKTILLKAPVTPNFMLLNVPQEGGGPSDMIVSVNNGNSDANLAQDDPAVVDGRYETSWVRKDWDAGFMYQADNKAPIITFDQAYTMDTVVIVPDYEQPYAYTNGGVYYWDEAGKKTLATGTFSRRQDADGALYYEFQASKPFTASKVQVAVRTYNQNRISYAELKFYAYFDLQERIYALYTDDLHVTLKDDVTQEAIEQLYVDLEYTDPASGEKTPRYDFLKQELDNAMTLLEQREVNARVLHVDNRLTDRQDSHITFRDGLNTWQPLGVAGLAGDKVFLYVGAEGKKLGDAANLTVIATQYHSECSALFQEVGQLAVGPNEIVIPKIGNMSSAEAGGQLYIRYNGAYGAENYAVRVTVPAEDDEAAGAAFIPVLNLTGVTDEETRASRIGEYLTELDSHDPEALHEKYHGDCGLAYDARNCVFGATDLSGERAMLSLPAAEVLRGLSTADSREQAAGDTLDAMDQMLTLFYQHKGLSDDKDAGEKNRMPVSRINIRYQRMFEGAFMYAGSAHIGIEWSSSASMMRGVPVVSDEKGRYVSGNFFGWGIGHEVGHEINEGAYEVAEVTNNYFAQLAQAKDTNEGMRFDYADVFKKVTSGAKGPSSNGAVQLAMYWQLHLAYDRDYNYKTYDTYAEQFDSLFYARVDSYARNAASAPAPGNVSLSLNSDPDNNLMRLACAAAEKNVLEFFERWGMEPDAATRKYAEQFAKETDAIWLASDDQRVAVMESDGPSDVTNTMTVTGSVSYDQSEGSGNLVHVTLESSDGSSDSFYGFEVFRTEYDGDQVKRRAVGFVPAGEDFFTDVISTVNNRAFTYEAVGYDIWLRPTERTELGSVRVSHNGGLDSSRWTVTTNMVTVGESEDGEVSEDNPDAVIKRTIERVIDQDNHTTYTGQTMAQQNADGSVTKAADPEIVLYLNGSETVTGMEYRLSGAGTPMGAFEVFVSEDGASWEKVEKAETTLTLKNEDGVQVQRIVFSTPATGGAAEGRELRSYTASMVKLTAPGQAGKEISVSEIALIGATGDKVDLDASGIGLLSEDYKNPGTEEVLIPKGSFVITGHYSGNPAYNTVLVWDENQNIVGGAVGDELAAEQIIFAPDPEDGDLTNISDGIWVYFITPDAMPDALPQRLRAELYRVDNALTQEGQRLVSSTIYVEVPETLPEITLSETGE